MEELLWEYPLKQFRDVHYTQKDKVILRELGGKKAEIASLPIQQQKTALWKKLNGLEMVRPMVWINEIPWHEMNVNDELTLQTSTEFARHLELRLRKTLYLWKHMRADMVVEPNFVCYIDHENTWFGIGELVTIAQTDQANEIYSRDFIPQIDSEDDLEKIKMPKVRINNELTEKKYHAMKDIFDGILPIEKRGVPGFWFAPWDELIRWWDVQKALADLALRPELVHKAMERLTQAYLSMLDQYEQLQLLALNNSNYRIGSGGLGFTDELPSRNYDPDTTTASDLWGNGTAQIFSAVSPKMHIEFSLNYEIQWMKRFGLNYYGCCEPLHKKIDILEQIPNLRKISMSPWVDLEVAAREIGQQYVFSYKPSPAIFVDDIWDATSIRSKLSGELKTISPCNVEIIMKDVSTVRYQPQKLWEWAKIAMDVVEQ